jgi:hypothetical protein
MPATPLTEVQKKAAIAIARSYWNSAFKAQYPNATKEQKLASWQQSRKEYLRLGKLAVRQLSRSGFQISGGA